MNEVLAGLLCAAVLVSHLLHRIGLLGTILGHTELCKQNYLQRVTWREPAPSVSHVA